MTRIPLHCPLPLRHWTRTADGWISQEWTEESRAKYDTTRLVGTPKKVDLRTLHYENTHYPY